MLIIMIILRVWKSHYCSWYVRDIKFAFDTKFVHLPYLQASNLKSLTQLKLGQIAIILKIFGQKPIDLGNI